jgi:HNH endonuclease
MRKFCSGRCWLAYEAVRRWVAVECYQCHRRFTKLRRTVKRGGHPFCSRACTRAYYSGERSPAFRGDNDPKRGATWNRLAEAIRVRDGHVCRRCGKTQADNKQKLSVDHVRPWREFEDKTEANDPMNLVALCRRCHSTKTLTTEAAWLRGDGLALQAYRRAVGIVT